MSSPPPGGPQTPPQQPYPPQYPPQQPYYAQPAAPPPKKSNTALIVVIVVVLIVVVVAIAWYAVTLMFKPVTATTSITAVSFAINYPGANQYFGATPITACSACPLSISVTSPAVYTLSLHNSDTVTHNVTGISISGLRFILDTASPMPTTGSPVAFAAGATKTITLTIGFTTLGGSDTLTGTISTN